MDIATDGTAHTRGRPLRTILAIDASRAHLHQLAQKLGPRGYLVVLSDRASDALELIAGRDFDLVLLDMGMPELPALHVLREIRGASESADLPVMLLGPADRATSVAAFEAGADDCVARPFDFDELAARIERTLARAARIDALKRSNLALDARIATRAIELGEARSALAAARTDRARLLASLGSTLHAAPTPLRAGLQG